MNEIVSFAIEKVTKLKEDDRFIYLDMFIALIGINSNGSFISKQTYEDAKSTIEYIPICTALNKNNSDFLEHEKDLKCIGTILSLEDNNYRYETLDNGRDYIVCNGIVFKEYCPQEALIIFEDGIKNTSLEIEVLKKTKKDGLFYFDEIRYQSCVILGEKFAPGMDGCHLEVTSDYRQKYSQDIENIKCVFSSSKEQSFSEDKTETNISESIPIPPNEFEPTLPPDNTDNTGIEEFSINNNPNNTNKEEKKKEDENNNMNFNKAEFALLNGMTANQIEEIFEDQCKSAGLDCWISDWSDKYVFIYDYKMSMHKAIPYVMEDNTFKLDFAGYKMARSTQVWIIDGDEDEMPETDMIQQMVSSIMDKMASEKSKIEEEYALEKAKTEETMACEKAKMEEEYASKQTELNEATEKMSLKEESILKMGQELDEIKEKYSSKETEVETLKSDITKYAKDKKEAEAEMILAKYSKKINEEERTELFAKLETYSSVEDFEKEVKAFVCDKYESEVKGKGDVSTYSRLGLPPATTEGGKTNDEHWVSYIKEYAPQVQK